MAVCEHCNHIVKPGDESLLQGYSYHVKCLKCFTCDETNLENAEVFKGVIFCSGCSQRIFRGPSTRRAKAKRRREARRPKNDNNHIIEIAGLNSVMHNDSMISKISKSISKPARVATNETFIAKSSDLEKKSVDMATTTDVTQELLEHIYYSVDKDGKFASPTKLRKKRKSHKENKKKEELCSDLRVAELGASTEIAHMALRRHSELPIIIKSQSALRKPRSNSLSYITQESESSGDGDQDSNYFSKALMKRHWMDRRLRSVVKLPYRSFKRNILDQSSVISAIMESEDSQHSIIRKLKKFFYEEATEHQRRGLRRLFSTINRKKIPYRLGWLKVLDRIPEDAAGTSNRLGKRKERRCKHYRRSHSYRCMRSQVMKMAGPTRSELTVLRTKMKDFICHDFLKRIYNYNKQFVNIVYTYSFS